MSLRARAQILEAQKAQQNPNDALTAPRPIGTFNAVRYGIVDNELVEIHGLTDIPGMSPAYLCTDSEGLTVPVAFRDVRIFTSPWQALQALQTKPGRI